MGIIYRLYPACAETRLARAHFWLHNIGLPVFMAGLGLILTGRDSMTWLAVVGATTLLVGLICFSINLLRKADT